MSDLYERLKAGHPDLRHIWETIDEYGYAEYKGYRIEADSSLMWERWKSERFAPVIDHERMEERFERREDAIARAIDIVDQEEAS